MPQATGANSRLIIQQETTFKESPSTPNAILLPFVSEDLRYSRNLLESATIKGTRDAAMPALGNVDVKGSIKMELHPYMAEIFKFLLGSVETTGSAPPYTHTFKVGSILPSFLVEKGFTDIGQYFLYNGCKINSFSLTAKAEGFQEVNVNIIGAKETVSTTSFDDTPINRGFRPFTGFDATVEEGGTEIAICKEISISVENNLDESVYVIGGAGERYSLPEGGVKVSGTVKALFESMNLYNKAKQSQETNLKVVYKFGTGDGSAGNEYLEFYFPEIEFQPNAPVISGHSGIFVEMSFVAYYDNNSDATSIKIVLKNTQSEV